MTHEDVPETLYHYTSLDALVSIVQSRRLRASSIRFLNDRSESLRLKEDVVGILRSEPTGSRGQKTVQTTIDLIESQPMQSLFVASLTEKADLLSQWRAYCPSGLGVSIGFSSDSLSQQWVANKSGDSPLFLSAPLQKVRYYGPTKQADLEAEVRRLLTLEVEASLNENVAYPNVAVLSAVAPLFKDVTFRPAELNQLLAIAVKAINEAEGEPGFTLSRPAGSTLAAWVFMLSPFIKHDAFEEECEWRKVISKDFRHMPGQRFRTGKSTLIPFVEVMLDKIRVESECVPSERYFINEVVVGPTPTPELTIEALASLFESEGQPQVRIRSSHIPYKDW